MSPTHKEHKAINITSLLLTIVNFPCGKEVTDIFNNGQQKKPEHISTYVGTC